MSNKRQITREQKRRNYHNFACQINISIEGAQFSGKRRGENVHPVASWLKKKKNVSNTKLVMKSLFTFIYHLHTVQYYVSIVAKVNNDSSNGRSDHAKKKKYHQCEMPHNFCCARFEDLSFTELLSVANLNSKFSGRFCGS
jgi:hypothetical protein